VSDGNYRATRDLTWGRAELIVWLDYPLHVVMRQLFWRTMRRWRRREVLWNGNRESLRTHFMTRNSLFLWALRSWWRHRRTYPGQLAGEYRHVPVVRIRSPHDLDRWLASLPAIERRVP
jgi:hypothetical protein